MKAIIVGAGIAGPVTALALRRAGIEPEIFERRPAAEEESGLFLTLAPNGMRVLDRLRLLDVVQDIDNIPTPKLAFYTSRGKRLGEVPNGELRPGVPSATMSRGSLHAALAQRALDEGIPVHYGKKLEQTKQLGSEVSVRFTDGSSAEADVLIGADGINSGVRQQMGIGSLPRDTGLLNLGGKVARSELSPTPDEMRMIWGRRAFFGYTVRANGEAWWFANVGADLLDYSDGSGGQANWKGLLLGLFEKEPVEARHLIAGTHGQLRAYPVQDMPPLPFWHRGRVALVGDAAHAVSPSSGQGASLAMEDAITLAKCLRDLRDVRKAFARYESLRRDRTERILEEGRRRGSHKALSSPLAVALRDAALSFAFRFLVSERSFAWILDHDIPWDSPTQAGART